MILAVVGSRTFNSYSLLEKSIKNLLFYNQITEIVSGGARGADQLGALFALSHKLQLKEFYPDWNKYGNSAGFKRNKLIIEYADIVIAFHDGVSRGTQNSIDLAKKLKKPCYVIIFDY